MEAIINEIHTFCNNNLKDSDKAIMDLLIRCDNSFEIIYISQQKIAQILGFSRSYVNQRLAYLTRNGLITKRYRHMKTCLYSLPTIMRTVQLRRRLCGIFKSMQFMSLRFLDQIKELTQYLNRTGIRNYWYNKNNRSTESIVKTLAVSSNSRESIQRITTLSLTQWGRYKIEAFPDEAIKEAEENLLHIIRTWELQKIRNPFRMFIKFCLNYCHRNNVQPDWKLSSRLASTYGMPHICEMITADQDERMKQLKYKGTYSGNQHHNVDKKKNYQNSFKGSNGKNHRHNFKGAGAKGNNSHQKQQRERFIYTPYKDSDETGPAHFYESSFHEKGTAKKVSLSGKKPVWQPPYQKPLDPFIEFEKFERWRATSEALALKQLIGDLPNPFEGRCQAILKEKEKHEAQKNLHNTGEPNIMEITTS